MNVVVVLVIAAAVLIGILIALASALGFVAHSLGVIARGASDGFGDWLGRKGSAQAELKVAPTLPRRAEQRLTYRDEWVQRLQGWRPEVLSYPSPPQAPTWPCLWSNLKLPATRITPVDVDELSGPLEDFLPPYDLLDAPDAFPPLPEGEVQLSLPPTPEYEPETLPPAELQLPYWSHGFRFLNRFVEAAHQDLIKKYRAAEDDRAEAERIAVRINRARREAWEDVGGRRAEALRQISARLAEARRSYAEARQAYALARDLDLSRLRAGRSGLATGSPEGIETHFDLVLRRTALPPFVPRAWKLRFDPETRVLLVEHRFPHLADLEVVREHGKVARIAQRHRQDTLKRVQPALLLRLAVLLAQADIQNQVIAVAVNGWVEFHDRSTGQPARAYCAALIADKASLRGLALDKLDPAAAVAKLCGRTAGEVYDLAPVEPQLVLQKDDPRFVKAKETLSGMAEGQNLAAMDWQDFEQLVRQMFEQVWGGAETEVKITRASRDQGVDAVIFDPDPMKGGKIVVQAKRYTNTVGVSAVRELIGTMDSERAIRGILVTTSQFGPDAHAAAQENGRLTLIDGQRLLGLLEQAGYRFRIDLEEAKTLARARAH